MMFQRNDPELKERRRKLRRDQTEAEKVFWSHVRNRQLHGLKFFRQYSLGPYVLDFFCPSLQLAIELDGSQHNQPDSIMYDAERTQYLHAHSIEVVRFWNHEVLTDMQSVLLRVEEKVAGNSP